MEITWFGHSCFRLTERNVAVVVTDPFDKSVGFSIPRLNADIVTISHDAPGHNNINVVRYARAITGPGEYEMKGVFITGLRTVDKEVANKALKNDDGSKTFVKNTVYVFGYDGLTVCHLGDLRAIPSQSEIEVIGTVGVLLVPVGGGGGLNAAQAAEVISLIEPSIVIPMHYKMSQTNLKLDPLSKFLKEMGSGKVEPQDSLKIVKSSVPDETQVVVLQPKGG